MAWRLASSVVRGEIENIQRGRVRGQLWLLGREKPVVLDLAGNPHRDLAGCKLVFQNAQPKACDDVELDALQRGVVGDMTASRKVRILDVSIEEASQLADADKPVPEHMGNAVYLEWFSEANGRVVVESTDFQVSLSAAAWNMTEKEEAAQQAQNREAIRDWLDRLSADTDDEEDGDFTNDAPMDEFQWEQFLRESDEMTEKYSQTLEKFQDHPDCDRLVAREMGWTWLEEALEAEERGALPPDDADGSDFDEDDEDDVPALVPNPLTEGVDWMRDEDGHIHHPLTARAHRVAMAMWHQCDELGLVGEDGDADVCKMIFHAQTLSAKLAGALDHLAYEFEREPGFVVACLKRALGFLHESLSVSDEILAKKSMRPDMVGPFRRNLFDIREQILHLMERFRHKQW